MPRLILEYASGQKEFVSYNFVRAIQSKLNTKKGTWRRCRSVVTLRQNLRSLARAPSRFGLATMAPAIAISQGCTRDHNLH
jgi:hypothetical protein